jgi:hypothetical protein
VVEPPIDVLETLDVSHLIQSGPFTEWTLGFKQSSFHHAVRVSTGLQLDGFAASRLSQHASFPVGFRRQVGWVTQGYHAQPLPSYSGITQAAMRRTFNRTQKMPRSQNGVASPRLIHRRAREGVVGIRGLWL